MFDEIVSELANQYVLSYSSTAEAGPRLAQHQGPGAEGQVRGQGPTGVSCARPRSGREGERWRHAASWVAALLATVVEPGAHGTTGSLRNRPRRYKTGSRSSPSTSACSTGRDNPCAGSTSGDFTVTVAGQPRRVVSAEFVEHASVQRLLSASTRDRAGQHERGRRDSAGSSCSSSIRARSNPGSARQVARAASRFFERLTFADRSALTLLPVGPNVRVHVGAHPRARGAAACRGSRGLSRRSGSSAA